MARPTELTAERQERICKAIRYGLPLESAARAAGVTYKTLHNWRVRGESDGSGIYFEFAEAVANALALFEFENAEIVFKGVRGGHKTETRIEKVKNTADVEVFESTTRITIAPPSAKLALELLQRRLPKTWNKTTTLKLESNAWREELLAQGIDPDEFSAYLVDQFFALRRLSSGMGAVEGTAQRRDPDAPADG